MRSNLGQCSPTNIKSAIAQLQRRIAGIERSVNDMIALPFALRTNWWKGQLRYFNSELIKLRKALKEMQEQGA